MQAKTNTPDLAAFVDGVIAELTSFLPIRDEYERFNADKAKLLRELDAQRAEIEENNKVIVSHNLNLQEIKRQISHAKEELVRAKLQQKKTLTKGALFKICENKTDDQRKIWGAINHLVMLGEAVEIEPSDVGRPTLGKWRWNTLFKDQ